MTFKTKHDETSFLLIKLPLTILFLTPFATYLIEKIFSDSFDPLGAFAAYFFYFALVLLLVIPTVSLGLFLTRKSVITKPEVVKKMPKTDTLVRSKINGWSWAAAGLGPIWALYHKIWSVVFVYAVALVEEAFMRKIGEEFIFISFFQLAAIAVLGIKGNQLAWKNSTITDPNIFLKKQKYWNIVGFIFCLVYLAYYSYIFSGRHVS